MAKQQLGLIKKETSLIDASAVASLEEDFDEALTLHRLGMFKQFGENFKMTNCIENIMRQICIYTDWIVYWNNCD